MWGVCVMMTVVVLAATTYALLTPVSHHDQLTTDPVQPLQWPLLGQLDTQYLQPTDQSWNNCLTWFCCFNCSTSAVTAFSWPLVRSNSDWTLVNCDVAFVSPAAWSATDRCWRAWTGETLGQNIWSQDTDYIWPQHTDHEHKVVTKRLPRNSKHQNYFTDGILLSNVWVHVVGTL